MVVLAASIVTKTGKPLVSRQYMDMSRIRIEGLLAAFPKLIGSGKQHTYVETENVRYIYQSLEGLYLLLITNKQSNILEDLETLRLLSKVVPEFVHQPDEESVGRMAFDLVFAFDEVICLGHKENVTIAQVRQNCEMESHEEKLHKMIIQSKINDTKDVMKRKAMEIEKTKLEKKVMGGMGGGAMAAFGASSSSTMAPPDMDRGPSFSRPEPIAPARSAAAARGPSKGMQLGKAKKANDFLESLAKEGEVVDLSEALPKAAAPSASAASAAVVVTDPVHITIDEKLSVTLDKDGGLANLDIQGTMSLVVTSDAEAFVKVNVHNADRRGFQFKTHPNIDKALFASDNVLALKDPSRPFPTGNELGILKWRLQSKDESLVPLNISCWPSVSGAQSYVNIEYESNSKLDLQNVQIVVPMPHMGHAPAVNQIDGEWRYDAKRNVLIWSIDLIDDTNRSGSMEMVTSSAEGSTFFPIEVSFSCKQTFCDVAVSSVINTQRDAPTKYGYQKIMSTAEYVVA